MSPTHIIMDEIDLLISHELSNKIVTLGHLYHMFHPDNLYSPINYYTSHINCLINNCPNYYDINVLTNCLDTIESNSKINQLNLCLLYKHKLIETLSFDIILDDNIDSIDDINTSLGTSFTCRYDMMSYLRTKCDELIDFFERKQYNNCKCYSCSIGDVSD